MRQLLSLLGMDTDENVELARSAFDHDSQQGAFNKRGQMFSLSDEDLDEVDRIFGLQKIGMTVNITLDKFFDMMS